MHVNKSLIDCYNREWAAGRGTQDMQAKIQFCFICIFIFFFQISSQTFSNFFEYTKTMQENSNWDNKLEYIVDYISRVSRSTWVLLGFKDKHIRNRIRR